MNKREPQRLFYFQFIMLQNKKRGTFNHTQSEKYLKYYELLGRLVVVLLKRYEQTELTEKAIDNLQELQEFCLEYQARNLEKYK